jgi:CRP-like cAMP-binding protein
MQEYTESAILSVFTDTQLGARTFSATNGEVIYHSQTAANNVYFVRRGQVRLYSVASDGSSRLVEILGPGNWFGAAALARSRTYRMKAVAVGGTLISEIGIERLLAALTRNPENLVELNRQLASRLLSAHEEGSRLVFEDCNQRLLNALLRFSQSAASTPREGGVVLRITHDQLAQAVGVARETITLALTQLRQQNLLQTGRNQLMFDPAALKQALGHGGNGHVRSEVAAGERETAATLV